MKSVRSTPSVHGEQGDERIRTAELSLGTDSVYERVHLPKVWRENRHPYQWIGSCWCGRGIRCNSRDDALTFFRREGCA